MPELVYSNVEKEMEVYGYDTVVKSHCRMCHGGCGVFVYLKDGKIEKIAGDPDCPINHGTFCSKGIGATQLVYHPDRLTYPVRRVGPKGSSKWERIRWDAILEEKPYPVKILFFISSNPLMTRGNAKEVHRALEAVEFMAVSDFFLTPTAELADIVLPAATWLEMDYIADFWKRHGFIFPRRKAVEVGECRSDHEMLNDLAHRVGQAEYWWDDFEGGLDYILEPMGINWKDFKEMDYVRGEVIYQKYKEKGFSTPTGKFELYSTVLERWGYDPLPQFREPPEGPVSTPALYEKYPYILITGRRIPGFFHTENRQLPWLRELHRDPMVEIHPQTATKEGIQEGDWVVIESPRGKVRQRAKFFEGMDPRIVSAEHGWWLPERKDPGHGWEESNINILTSNAYAHCDPAMGATPVRTLLCRISPEA